MPKCPIPLSACDSSQIKEAGYDAATKKLAIRFHGKSGERHVYVYDGVPQEHHAGLMEASAHPEKSAGKYFGEHIKGKKDLYPFTKIDELAEEQPS